MRAVFKHIIVYLLRLEAKAVLRKYKPRIVAVTGSVGKTSTKDAIYEVLRRDGRVRKSEKSFNSEIGLPLTILGVPNAWNNPLRWVQNLLDGLFMLLIRVEYPEWLVLEVGADRPGDISSLSSWLPVEVAVITRLPEVPVHVEFFDSPEQVAEEKAALIDCLALLPEGRHGALVLFADDPRVLALQNRIPAPDALVLTFGFSAGADVRGQEVRLLREESAEDWPIGMTAKISSEHEAVPVNIMGAAGAHAFLPALAAAAVGAVLGKSLGELVPALQSYEPPAGRMRLLRGIKNTLLIDDTYNASPAAVEAALKTLNLVAPKGRRIAAVGDMLELGRHSTGEHRKAGAVAAESCDLLLTVGFRARDLAQGALDAGLADAAILQFEDAAKAGAELKNIVQEGDCVLVKGSQSIRMERVVEELMAEPERAQDLLVRQDAEWKKR